MANGQVITFEGGEGAGKSTQAELIAGRSRGRVGNGLGAREPGGRRVAGLALAERLDGERAKAFFRLPFANGLAPPSPVLADRIWILR